MKCKRVFSLLFLMCLCLFGCSSLDAANATTNKPNIILMMADDLGWGDTGYNGNKIIKTPALDKMAKEGVRFDRFYSAAPVCSPTRASVLTGRHPFRTGIFNANNGILRPEEITLPEILKEQGYTTGHFGKWHLGTLTDKEKDANRGRPGKTELLNPPKVHGYEMCFVTESKVPTYDPMKRPKYRDNKDGWQYLKEDEGFTHYGTYYWDIDGNKVLDNLDGDDSRVIMDRAIPFIEGAVKKGEPFLAVVWFHTPHKPCVAGPRHHAMYKGYEEKVRNYAGCITAMDEQVGRLRDKLKALGVADNTMVWFCSDNGPENGNPGITGGFKERKRSLHDGGVRVPGLLVWPDKVKGPMVTDVPYVTSDYMPTIMDVLGLDAGKLQRPLDGISLVPLLDGKMKRRPTPIGFCASNQMNMSDNRYKLYSRAGKVALYDMIDDKFETTDISAKHPDIVKQMQKDFGVWFESCKGSFEGDEYGKKSYERLGQKWHGGRFDVSATKQVTGKKKKQKKD